MYGDVKVILQPGKRTEAVKAAIADGWELISVLPGGQDGEKTILAYVMGKREHSHARREVKTLLIAAEGESDATVNEYLAEGWDILNTEAVVCGVVAYAVYILIRTVEEES